MVNVNVGLRVEAPAAHCHALFSDLSLMSEWSSTLRAVTRDVEDARLSTWDFAWNGISLTWRAEDLEPEDGDGEHVIRWRSISGLNHVGCVTFNESVADDDTASPISDISFSVDYDVASLVAVFMQSAVFSPFVRRAVEFDLQRFRSFALRRYRRARREQVSAAPK